MNTDPAESERYMIFEGVIQWTQAVALQSDRVAFEPKGPRKSRAYDLQAFTVTRGGSPASGRRADVLVHAEQVGRVVFLLQRARGVRNCRRRSP